MNYRIIATLGPSSAQETIWREMRVSGVNAFRLNTSHLSLKELHLWLERLDAFFNSFEEKYPIVLDLQGSKWRLGQFPPFELVPGEYVELICGPSTDQKQTLPVPHEDFFQAAASSNQEIVLNDARTRLRVVSTRERSLKAQVTQGGAIVPRKGITFTASNHRQESLSEKDQSILEQTRHLDFIHYALSYVKDGIEMTRYREIFGPQVHLIAKIERQTAVDEALQIAETADELWLCRGDLGAELGIRAMAEVVHRFTYQLDRIKIPVLMAGQVLEHMTTAPIPTRSEVCYLYETLIRGYSGLVLSDETAVGQYPLESCKAAALFKP